MIDPLKFQTKTFQTKTLAAVERIFQVALWPQASPPQPLSGRDEVVMATIMNAALAIIEADGIMSTNVDVGLAPASVLMPNKSFIGEPSETDLTALIDTPAYLLGIMTVGNPQDVPSRAAVRWRPDPSGAQRLIRESSRKNQRVQLDVFSGDAHVRSNITDAIVTSIGSTAAPWLNIGDGTAIWIRKIGDMRTDDQQPDGVFGHRIVFQAEYGQIESTPAYPVKQFGSLMSVKNSGIPVADITATRDSDGTTQVIVGPPQS